MDDTALPRLRWRCRRGSRELDLLLGGWLERGWDVADGERRRSFQRLLELPDPTLAAWLIGGARPEDRQLASLVDEIVRTRP